MAGPGSSPHPGCPIGGGVGRTWRRPLLRQTFWSTADRYTSEERSQGGFVEFTFDEAGLYPIVTHKFANVGKGALGLFQAGDVEAVDGGH
jgi:hypothetical protein